MATNFDPQILVDKLMKLNSTQQSIENLSHWCIFHMNKAKQIVETWHRQFHCSPREQRLAFLYLANDIIQNSRRKGLEFVVEFWKVLPDTLRDVIESGDDFGKNAALRLINIWEERKVFGSKSQQLKDEFLMNGGNRNLKHGGFKLRPPGETVLDKLATGFQAVYGTQLDEGAIIHKCRDAISFVEQMDKGTDNDYRFDDGSIQDALKGQWAALSDCIKQLAVVESSRANLVTLLQQALQEEEYKLNQVRDQLQAAHTCSEQADDFWQQHFTGNGQVLEQNTNPGLSSQAPQSLTVGNRDQSASVIYTRQVFATETCSPAQEDPKMPAVSAPTLSFLLSSLASEGVIANPTRDSSTEYPSEKRAKIDKEHPASVPTQNPQVPVTSFSNETSPSEPPPPPPSSPPPMPPLPPPLQPYQVPQYTHPNMTMPIGAYGYSMMQPLQAPAIPGYVPVGPPLINGVPSFAPPSHVHHTYPTAGGLYSQQSSLPMAPTGQQ